MSYPNQDPAAVLCHLHGTLMKLAAASTRKPRIVIDPLAAVITTRMPREKAPVVTNPILGDYAELPPQFSAA